MSSTFRLIEVPSTYSVADTYHDTALILDKKNGRATRRAKPRPRLASPPVLLFAKSVVGGGRPRDSPRTSSIDTRRAPQPRPPASTSKSKGRSHRWVFAVISASGYFRCSGDSQCSRSTMGSATTLVFNGSQFGKSTDFVVEVQNRLGTNAHGAAVT